MLFTKRIPIQCFGSLQTQTLDSNKKTFKKQALLAAARLGTHFMGTKVREITNSEITINTTVYCTIQFDTSCSKLVSMQFSYVFKFFPLSPSGYHLAPASLQCTHPASAPVTLEA